jgi:hypothetical protein
MKKEKIILGAFLLLFTGLSFFSGYDVIPVGQRIIACIRVRINNPNAVEVKVFTAADLSNNRVVVQTSVINDVLETIPPSWKLYQNYPNPFN